jgi:hypothetical protein
MSSAPYPLKNSTILDSGTTLHIFNNLLRLMNFRKAPDGDFVWAGDNKVRILGYGEVYIKVKPPHSKPRILRLQDVAYCENFACNLVSLRVLQSQGYWWNTRQGHLYNANGEVAAVVEDLHNQYVLEYLPLNTPNAALIARRNEFNSYTKRRPLLSEPMKWHLRLGHPGPEALERLVNYSHGARIKGRTSIKGVPTYKCDGCGLAKARRQIRRQPREFSEGIGERLALDRHDFEQDDRGFRSLLLVTDRWSGYAFDLYLKDGSASSIIEALTYLINHIKYQHNVDVKVIECDNEFTDIKPEVARTLSNRNIRMEPSAPYTQSQNGAAERSGSVIKDKIRAMRTSSHLPSKLWREVTRAAVYLYNRTPRYYYNWSTPYERFHMILALRNGLQVKERKPQQAHLRVYGCKAYAASSTYLTKKERLKRLNPRNWIGYLVGYDSTNIYRVWNPKSNRVVRTRDVCSSLHRYPMD